MDLRIGLRVRVVATGGYFAGRGAALIGRVGEIIYFHAHAHAYSVAFVDIGNYEFYRTQLEPVDCEKNRAILVEHALGRSGSS